MTESAIEDLSVIPHAGPAVTIAAPLRGVGRNPLAILLRLLQSPGFAYAVILLLQLKVVWRAWDLRDLTSGDTPDYYVRAVTWYQDWLVNIVWSPLYLAFYGTLMHLTQDVFSVTTLHRLVIVFLATAGVLGVFRRLLPHWLALLAAAWWTILPINFDTLYEVHLFALLPVLAAWLVILRRPRTAAGGEWRRGIALAILVLSTFLVRNETVVAVGCLGLVCVIYELRKRRLAYRMSSTPGQSGAGGAEDSSNSHAAPPRIPPVLPNLGVTLLRYAVPTLLVLLLVVGAYFRSFIRFKGYVLHGQPQPRLGDVWHVKHTLNMAQVYAYGYQQRHPEWDKNPWTACGELSLQTFGRRDPSITDMLRRNPRATLEHFAWNFRLVPAGLQVLLFNATSFRDNPDYAAVIFDPDSAVPLSLTFLALVAVGLLMVAFRWRYWWDYWLRDRAWGWAAILAVAFTVVFIIPTQRPRPSYLFSFGVLLMSIAGMSVFVILHTLTGLLGLRTVPGKPVRAWVPAIAAVLFAAVLAGLLWILYITHIPQQRPFLGLTPLTVLLAGRVLAGVCIFLLTLALAGLLESIFSGHRPAEGKPAARAWVTVLVVAIAPLAGFLWILHISRHPGHHHFLGLSPQVSLLTGWFLAGTCIFLLTLALGLAARTRESGIFAPVLPAIMAVVLAALILFVPSYYVVQAAQELPQDQRQVLRTYLALRPYQSYIQRKDTVFMKGAYNLEMHYYLGLAEPSVVTMDYSGLDEMKSGESLADFLDRKKINLFFLDNDRWSQLEAGRRGVVQDLIEHGNADGWRLVGFEDQPADANSGYQYLSRWLLFRKAAPDGSGGFDPDPAGLSAGHRNDAFTGWREAAGLGPVEGPFPQWHLPVICWGYGPATKLTIPAAGQPAQGGRYKLVFSGLCSWIDGQKLTVKLDGHAIGEFQFLPRGTFCDYSVPMDLSPGQHELLLEYSKWQSDVGLPPRGAVTFRKLQILPDQSE